MEHDKAVLESSKPRLRYSRDALLELKKEAEPLTSFSNNVAAVQRSLRSKQKQTAAFRAPISDRSRDTSNIVLGPQKRTWNTGCHVSTTLDPQNEHPTNRGGKFSDRLHHSSNGSRRDYRGAFHNRDRINNRRDFLNSRFRDDRSHKDEMSRAFAEEEPEWFSEGPSTVNETIELGKIIEFGDDMPNSSTDVKDDSKSNADADDKIVDVPDSSDFLGNNSTRSDLERDKEFTESPVTSSVSFTNQGSRFKHLFTTSQDVGEISSSKVNEKLQQLLKISQHDKPSQSNSELMNVIQVENKLRSILLGHNASQQTRAQIQTPQQTSKPQAPTVEEIESQLGCLNSDKVNSDADNVVVSTSARLSNNPNVQGNLAPVLQDLLRISRSRNSALTSIGPLPQQTNAISASARISQLQQEDTLRSFTDPLQQRQGVLRQMWDSEHNSAFASAANFPVNKSTVTPNVNWTPVLNNSNIDQFIRVQNSLQKPIIKTPDRTQLFNTSYSNQMNMAGPQFDQRSNQHLRMSGRDQFGNLSFPVNDAAVRQEADQRDLSIHYPSANLYSVATADHNAHRPMNPQKAQGGVAFLNNLSTWDRLIAQSKISQRFATQNTDLRTQTVDEIESSGLVSGRYF